MLETLTHESFEPYVGTGFAIAVADVEDELTLTEIRPGKPIPGFDRTPFALTFVGASKELMFHSQTIDLKHPELGTLGLLISPYGRNEDGTFRYEAIFG